MHIYLHLGYTALLKATTDTDNGNIHRLDKSNYCSNPRDTNTDSSLPYNRKVVVVVVVAVAVVVVVHNTDYFIHSITGNYNVNSHIKITQKQ